MAGTLGIATLQTDVDLKGLDRGLQEGKRATEKGTTGIGDLLKANIGNAAVAAAGIAAAAIVDFAQQSLAEFQTFEQGAAEVFTLLPGMSADAMSAMQQDVLDFSVAAGRTTDEVLPALYQALSAGVPAENVFEFLETASDAARGGVTDLETAVDGISSVVNAYGADVLDAATASDVMFTAVRLGKTDFTQLSSTLFNVIPTAASLGVTFTDVAANLAALTAQGTPTSVATTQLRAAFVEASKSGTQLDKALRDLTGQGFADLIAGGQTSAEIFSALRASMPEQAFRDLFSSVEASNAVLGITSETASGIIEAFGGVEDTMGATAAAAETMAQSMQYLEERAAAATEAAKIQAGQAIGPLKAAWLQAKISVAEYTAADLALKTQIETSRTAFGRFGDRINNTRLLIEELGEGTLLWRDSMVDAETLALRTDAAVELLERGFQGTREELAAAAIELVNTRQEMEALEAAVAATATADAILTGRFDETAAAAADVAVEVDKLTGLTSGLATENEKAAAVTDVFAGAVGRGKAQLVDIGGVVESAVDVVGAFADAQRNAADAAEEMRARQAEAAAQLGSYFNSALTATEETKSLEMRLYEAAVAAGAGAAELAVLAANTGEFTQAQIEAAFQTALMQANIDALVQSMVNGEISAGQAAAALGELGSGAASTATEAINLVTGVGAAARELDTLQQNAASARSALLGIPTSIGVHIAITSDPLPPIPGTAGAPATPFARGGWTGMGPADAIAGVVHARELVVPAGVLAGGMDALAAFAYENVPAGVMPSGAAPPMVTSGTTVSGAGGDTIYIDARGAAPGVEERIRAVVRQELQAAGRDANARIRTGF